MSKTLDIPWTEPSELRGSRCEVPWNTSYAMTREVRRAKYLARREALAKRDGVTMPQAPPLKAKAPVTNAVAAFKRQCIAFNRITLERCGNHAMRGQMICKDHGGSTPLAKLNAKQRLAEMCEPALAVLREMMSDAGVEDDVRLKAALAVLDRAGYSPKHQLTLRDKRETSLNTMTRDQLIDRGRRIMQEIEARSADAIDTTADIVVPEAQRIQ
jgi:hypothetical protein